MLRRSFLKASALAATASIAGLSGGGIHTATSRRPIGLQLFTVLEPLERDLAGTLENVARIGYREVETMATFDRDPRYVRELLDRYGLLSPSQHLVPGDLYPVLLRFVRGEIQATEFQELCQKTMRTDRIKPIVEEGIA